MKNLFLKLMSAVLALAVFSTPVFAKENEYSYEDYLEILQEEGDKYDVEVTLDDSYLTTDSFTQSQLDEAKEAIRSIGEDTTIKPHEPSPSDIAVYASGVKYGYFDVVAPNGMATIAVEIYASTSTTKVNSAYIRDIYQSGVSLGFQSWTTTNSSLTLNTPSNGYVRANVSGRVTFNISGIVVTKNVTNQGVLIYCL